MSNLDDNRRAVLTAFASLGSDIVSAPSKADAERLVTMLAAAAGTQLRIDPSVRNSLLNLTTPAGIEPMVTEEELANIRANLEQIEGDASADDLEDIIVVRRDDRNTLLSGELDNPVSGVIPNEIIGPFIGHDGLVIWFDIYLPAQRIEVREKGTSAPAIVFTEARRKFIHSPSSKVDIEEGTVWIRGDLIDGTLPANAYVGIKVDDGSLKLNQSNTVNGNVINISSPLTSVLELKLSVEEVIPVEQACLTANTQVIPPEKLIFEFNAGSLSISGTGGKAEVWEQEFSFATSTGSWEFIEHLWTIVLGYEFEPNEFNAEPINDDLVGFDGVGQISSAGLGFPVVSAPSTSILGEAATAPQWALKVHELTAHWYKPDKRSHILQSAWIIIAAYGAVIRAEDIAPLAPAVTHIYKLWAIQGSEHRLCWQQTYSTPFLLHYKCHVIEGEHFMVHGDADVDLDRPLMTNGQPVPTPSRLGIELLHQYDGEISTTLGALIERNERYHQFALQNALVWTTAPIILLVSGQASIGQSDPQHINAGQAQLLFGVYGWSPILPDPYVSNLRIEAGKELLRQIHSLLTCQIQWTNPQTVSIRFDGMVGGNLAMTSHPPIDRKPRGGSTRKEITSGLTQTIQGQTNGTPTVPENPIDRERLANAQKKNVRLQQMLASVLVESIGNWRFNVRLLDVSTNQDLFGVGITGRIQRLEDPPRPTHDTGISLIGGAVMNPDTAMAYRVIDSLVQSALDEMSVFTLPQVQWEPVRTLDVDQNDVAGLFPTPLASATDGYPTIIGSLSERLMPIIPEDAIQGTLDAFREDATPVGILTTFPFGLASAIRVLPDDDYELTRPEFKKPGTIEKRGGLQVTARPEGDPDDTTKVSPTFQGAMVQLINGIDLQSGAPLGVSVLAAKADSHSDVETIFNADMLKDPRVPVTRVDLSGYGASNFSDWTDPFARPGKTTKVQFQVMVGRTALEVIKVNSVLYPWGVRVTRTVTVERRSGGGVVRRDSGWQPVTNGIFDYRYKDKTGEVVDAEYNFDTGVFRGIFNVRQIRPAPGTPFKADNDLVVPYYFDADVALENVAKRVTSVGILGYLHVTPVGEYALSSTLQKLIQQQGPIGGPLQATMLFGHTDLCFDVRRIEVDLAETSNNDPVFVAAIRGAPKLPSTGAWSVVTRQVKNVPNGGGEATLVSDTRGVPLIRRYAVKYDTSLPIKGYSSPQRDTKVPLGNYRLADPSDLLQENNPVNEYALLQSTPTHAFLFPRPYNTNAGNAGAYIQAGNSPALADIMARTLYKSPFPPPEGALKVQDPVYFNVNPEGKLALSNPIKMTPKKVLQMSGAKGNGMAQYYDGATLHLDIEADRWEANFTNLYVWTDMLGAEKLMGNRVIIAGSTEERSKIVEVETILADAIQSFMDYLPFFKTQGVHGPFDLASSNAGWEIFFEFYFNLSTGDLKDSYPVLASLPIEMNLAAAFMKHNDQVLHKLGLLVEGTIPGIVLGADLIIGIELVLGYEFMQALILDTTDIASSATETISQVFELIIYVGVGKKWDLGFGAGGVVVAIGFVWSYDITDDKHKVGGLARIEGWLKLKVLGLGIKIKVRAEGRFLKLIGDPASQCETIFSLKITVEVSFFFSVTFSAKYKYKIDC